MDMMRILATCQYGWPEPHPSLYPMEEMAKRGHYVHAVTGTPNYPMLAPVNIRSAWRSIFSAPPWHSQLSYGSSFQGI